MSRRADQPGGVLTAPVNKIIPFSAVDGFGNRTAVFLQGCNQNCLYCHNPETIHLCVGCGTCVDACPAGALSWAGEEPAVGAADAGCTAAGDSVISSAGSGVSVASPSDVSGTSSAGVRRVAYDFDRCVNCDTCIKVCPNDASPKIRNLTPEELFDQVKPFFPFIDGITTSGGECGLYLEFLTEFYRLVKGAGKTTYMDTNGQISLAGREEFLAVTDKTMIDLKAGTDEDHRRLTGRDLGPVTDNIRLTAELGKLYEIRTVVVPDVADSRKTVELGASLIAPYPEVRYKLIKFRKYGVRENFSQTPEPSDELMESLREIAWKKGVKEVVIT
ncbi:MAG TPA: radical SAM protein [Candidatus Lachnoclostridium avicola]|nr:radical SAM protein [Candidatus Lachnoclostridium avicola]